MIGILSNIIAAPNNETNEVKVTPKPVAKAHAIPDERPEPIDVAIVLRTFGPGIKTLMIKKPNAGIIVKKLVRITKFFHNALNL